MWRNAGYEMWCVTACLIRTGSGFLAPCSEDPSYFSDTTPCAEGKPRHAYTQRVTLSHIETVRRHVRSQRSAPGCLPESLLTSRNAALASHRRLQPPVILKDQAAQWKRNELSRQCISIDFSPQGWKLCRVDLCGFKRTRTLRRFIRY